jgi:glycerophosphoryl diester phosphodiesterase
MSLDQEKDIKDEQLKNNGKDITIENNLKIPKEENKVDTIPEQPDETVENYDTHGTIAYLNLEHFQNEVPKKKNIPNDISTVVLNQEEIPVNETLNQLNNQKDNAKNGDGKTNNTSQNLSFMQRTKSWMSNMWTNVKNYNYGKYNIFKRTEMEDVLDAHGNHMKIPKNRKEKELKRIKTDNKEGSGLKYGNINYDGYYTSSNINVFSGYPF